jgi:protein gp37
VSNIEWTGQTLNPTTGCDRISPGCDRCYAMTMAKRLKSMGQAKYQNDGDPTTSGPGFGLTMHDDVIYEPLTWKKPRLVFVNSMSDLFHDKVDADFIAKFFGVMALTPRCTYQILTKRHGRMRSLLNSDAFHTAALAWSARLQDENHPMPAWHPGERRLKQWPLPNVHLGVSVEDQKWADIRIKALMQTPAAIRFLSLEPLLGPVRLHRGHAHCPTHDFPGGFCSSPCPDLILPDWMIIGGESGPGARPFNPQWAADLIDDARQAGAAPFVKQLGSVWARDTTYAGKTVAAHGDTKGGKPEYWPANLRVREYPKTATADA